MHFLIQIVLEEQGISKTITNMTKKNFIYKINTQIECEAEVLSDETTLKSYKRVI